jgi:putative glutamine amidotransferase
LKRFCCNIIILVILLSLHYSKAYPGNILRQRIQVAVSKVSPNYLKWLKKGDSTILGINMYELRIDSALLKLENCSGLLLTGGEDVHPQFYGKPEEVKNCSEIDIHRDSLEIALIKKALSLKMPILGICRGEQIMNVVLGGTLIEDIPTYFLGHNKVSVIHQCKDYLNCYHSVTVVPHTLIRSIMKSDSGYVSSNHHQAIENLGQGLRRNAMSGDKLTEGIEWENPDNKSFLIGVQWHPERMDIQSDYSGKLLHAFLDQVVKYNVSTKKIKK